MLTRSLPPNSPSTKQQLNQYYNNYNYFNKSTIKLSQLKRRLLHQMHLENNEVKNRNQLPKMLYSSTMTSKENKTFDQHQLTKQSEEGHVNRPLFSDLFDCVDSIGIQLESEPNNEIMHDLEEEKVFITKPNATQDPKVKLMMEITDSSVAQDIKDSRRNPKDILQFNNFGKYKYSRQGLNFPKGTDKYDLPFYDGDNSRECKYFNFRKQINNPKIVYNAIGSFNEKFNKDLSRISRSYGTEKSKGHFVSNPLLNSYRNVIPIYELYRDIKFVENRYTDKRSKFKLLPLINAKIRNFDRLGNKVYQSIKKQKQKQAKVGAL